MLTTKPTDVFNWFNQKRPFLLKLYADLILYLMQMDLNSIQENGKTHGQYLKECYETSVRYWSILRGKLANHTFDSEAEEIHFFRHIKPKFTSEIEYFGILYHLEIFKPDSKEDLEWFLERECKRLDSFKRDHREFYDYYKNNRTDKDDIYFLRTGNNPMNFIHFKPYDLELKACTSHDHLIASILALEKYILYLKEKFNIECEANPVLR